MIFSIYKCNANIASVILEVVRCCFGIVLFHVLLQLIRLFEGVVALLAGKRSLAGV